MRFRNYSKIAVILKLTEISLIGLSVSYTSIMGQKVNLIILIGIYLSLFITWFIDSFYNSLLLNNLNLLIKHFYEANNFENSADIRITIHKKNDKISYRQFVDYYPNGAKRGKRHLIEKGIVRYAFSNLSGEFSENFETMEEKIEKLIQKYNFRKEEADQQVRDGELSYYCCPIMNEDKIWGVLYLNAKKLHSFPNQSELYGSQFSYNVRALVKMIENEIS